MNYIDFQDKECHKKTFFFFIISLLSSLLPTLICLLVFRVVNQNEEFIYFIQKGEFYLYSTGILTPGALILYDEKNKSYDIFSILFWSSLVVIVVSSLLYLLTLLIDLKKVNFNFDSEILTNTSVWFLIFSVIVLYVTSYMQNFKVDVKKSSIQDIEDIKNKLG